MQYLKALLKALYNIVVTGKEKAIVAFLVAAVTTFVARHGLTFDATTANFLQAGLFGLLAHLSVYFTSNRV